LISFIVFRNAILALSETAVIALFLRVDLLRRFDIGDDIYAWRGVITQLFTEANR